MNPILFVLSWMDFPSDVEKFIQLWFANIAKCLIVYAMKLV